jgi:hypothetical protein
MRAVDARKRGKKSNKSVRISPSNRMRKKMKKHTVSHTYQLWLVCVCVCVHTRTNEKENLNQAANKKENTRKKAI